jgi:hypothetical protein
MMSLPVHAILPFLSVTVRLVPATHSPTHSSNAIAKKRQSAPTVLMMYRELFALDEMLVFWLISPSSYRLQLDLDESRPGSSLVAPIGRCLSYSHRLGFRICRERSQCSADPKSLTAVVASFHQPM